MSAISKIVLPALLTGLLAGCVGGGGYYSSGGYGYEQPYQPYGYNYAPSSYGYGFSYDGGDRDYGGGGNYWRYHSQDQHYGSSGNGWRYNRQSHDYGRSFAVNQGQSHWQSQSNWKKKL